MYDVHYALHEVVHKINKLLINKSFSYEEVEVLMRMIVII